MSSTPFPFRRLPPPRKLPPAAPGDAEPATDPPPVVVVVAPVRGVLTPVMTVSPAVRPPVISASELVTSPTWTACGVAVPVLSNTLTV